MQLVVAAFLLQLLHSTSSFDYHGDETGSSLVGSACSTNTDCVHGAYCRMGACNCMNSYVAVEKYCWRKISPEESGCIYDEQCGALWPGANCQSNTCKCPQPLQAAVTREGVVCHPKDECPTNGRNSLLYNRNTGTPSMCFLLNPNNQSWEFIGCDDFPEVHNCIDGLCCPTKALTCIQPIDMGRPTIDNFTTTRWYHDPISHSCQYFPYTGLGGNSNNFPTKGHCELYCLLAEPPTIALRPPLVHLYTNAFSWCARGQPLIIASKAEWNSSCTACTSNNFDCTATDDEYRCCPTVDFICSEFGGLQTVLPQQKLFHQTNQYSPGSQRQDQHPVTRWYWDRIRSDCLPFTFFGQGGNFNNFQTKEHCNDFCSVDLCPVGSPLYGVSGSPTSCTSSLECPVPYSCQRGRCCPNSDSVCNQPLSEGILCIATPVTRFWFNASAGACQLFSYNGCGGNSNIFSSLDACQETCTGIEVGPYCRHGQALRKDDGKLARCGVTALGYECPINYECYHDRNGSGCCPSSEYICSLPLSTGRHCGQTSTTRWYFDGTTNSCRSFLFKGCDGNMNIFTTKQSCEEFCPRRGLTCPYGAMHYRRSTGEDFECFSDRDCPFNHACMPPILYRGIERRLCCPTRLSNCKQVQDSGNNCGQLITRFFFDNVTKLCKPMKFWGCGGNSNNFPSEESCYKYCLSSACAPSEVVLLSSTFGIPFNCSDTPCPPGYSCVVDVWNPKSMVCCGTPNFDGCPDGLQALIDLYTLLPISCRGNNCPSSSHCLFHPQKKRHFCCGSSKRIESCPSGSRLVLLKSGDRMGCNLHAHCPEGATCYRSNSVFSGVCCRSLSAAASFVASCISATRLAAIDIMNADQGDGNCSEKIYIGVRPVFSNDNRENGVKIQKLELGGITARKRLNAVVFTKNDEDFLWYWFRRTNTPFGDAPVSELCDAPMNIGVTCNDAHLTAPERYYYDPKTSTCRRFFYQGCGGNANNFQDEAKCVAVCETAVVATLSRETTIFTRSSLNERHCSSRERCPGQTVCVNEKCACRPGQVQLRGMCYWKCPAGYRNVDSICIQRIFDYNNERFYS